MQKRCPAKAKITFFLNFTHRPAFSQPRKAIFGLADKAYADLSDGKRTYQKKWDMGTVGRHPDTNVV